MTARPTRVGSQPGSTSARASRLTASLVAKPCSGLQTTTRGDPAMSNDTWPANPSGEPALKMTSRSWSLEQPAKRLRARLLQLEFDAGIGATVAGQQAGKVKKQIGGLHYPDGQGASPEPFHGGDRIGCGASRRQGAAGFVEQSGARRGQLNVTRGAGKESGAKLPLQGPDGGRKTRLGDE